mmetsp:Transcript_22592/g.38710  ORF Transcript_22592/g.38710 Transcript_22592/m.38710 type:complete len:382 (-) Transcript_22592:607-1752(-)
MVPLSLTSSNCRNSHSQKTHCRTHQQHIFHQILLIIPLLRLLHPFLNPPFHKCLHHLGIIWTIGRSNFHRPQRTQFLGNFWKGVHSHGHSIAKLGKVRGCEAHGSVVGGFQLMNSRDTHSGMRTEHVIVFGVVFFDDFQRGSRISLGALEVSLGLLEFFPRNGELASRFKGGHPRSQSGGVISRQMIKIPFKVGTNANVHRGTNGLLNIIPMIFSLGEESVQNIIFIRSHNQIPHRQSHPLGIISSQNIPKVSGGDRKVHLLHIAFRIRHAQITPEVIRRLSQHSAPINTVHSTQLHLLTEILIIETRLDNILTIIKRSIHSHAVNIVIRHCGHLSFLNFTHTSIGVKDDTVNALFATEAVDGSGTSVATGGTKDGKASTV